VPGRGRHDEEEARRTWPQRSLRQVVDSRVWCRPRDAAPVHCSVPLRVCVSKARRAAHTAQSIVHLSSALCTRAPARARRRHGPRTSRVHERELLDSREVRRGSAVRRLPLRVLLLPRVPACGLEGPQAGVQGGDGGEGGESDSEGRQGREERARERARRRRSRARRPPPCSWLAPPGARRRRCVIWAHAITSAKACPATSGRRSCGSRRWRRALLRRRIHVSTQTTKTLLKMPR